MKYRYNTAESASHKVRYSKGPGGFQNDASAPEKLLNAHVGINKIIRFC